MIFSARSTCCACQYSVLLLCLRSSLFWEYLPTLYNFQNDRLPPDKQIQFCSDLETADVCIVRYEGPQCPGDGVRQGSLRLYVWKYLPDGFDDLNLFSRTHPDFLPFDDQTLHTVGGSDFFTFFTHAIFPAGGFGFQFLDMDGGFRVLNKSLLYDISSRLLRCSFRLFTFSNKQRICYLVLRIK